MEVGVNLLIAYLVAVLVGQAAVLALALVVDHFYSPFASLLIFFPLFFGMFWLAWRVSVKFTEPRAAA
jgi:hypothetical protein